jgi:L-seryl-tRNA(Ser) seleniumtransferase
MFGRRSFLEALASTPVLSALLPATALAAGKRDIIRELGVRTFINAAGTYTALTASIMPPEVMQAMQTAWPQYVSLVELQTKVGERLASLLKCESAMVTSGAAGALTVGTAGCVTGKDPKAILQLPDTTGLKSQVIMQKAHRFGYDHAVTATGVKIVEIETEAELEAAAGPQTAMMLFFNDAEPRGRIDNAGWVRLGKKLGIPTFVDAAADTPPVENLWKYTGMGYDLVAFSGGKGIRGPQSAGLLLGRKDLIEAARLNTSPNGTTISRGMKVNKEEMVGMLAAVERFLQLDHAAERREWDRRADLIRKAAMKLKSVESDIVVPPIANNVPHLRIKWDPAVIRLTPQEAMKKLREGSPSIEACPMTNKEWLVFGVWMMQKGDAETVAKRTVELLKWAMA